MGQDNWTMSSKLFTSVVALCTIVPFGYFVTAHAVSTTQDLQKQTIHIQSLRTESEQLDKKLETTQQAKEQTKQEVDQLDQEKVKTVSEREKLEAELSQLGGQ